MEVLDHERRRNDERKRERNKKRRRACRAKRKELLKNAYSICKELEEKRHQLAEARSKVLTTQKKFKALAQCKPPQFPPPLRRSSTSKILFNKPTATSCHKSSHRLFCHLDLETEETQLRRLDRNSLKKPCGNDTYDVGSGSFGKCMKMLLCSTEVAVKTTTLKEYSYNSVMYEAKVMARVCCGHPNLPLFIGVYDHQDYAKPLLVMKFYSVNGKALTLHSYLISQYRCHSKNSQKQWSFILIGVCNGLEAIHKKGYLHNDLKCDNIVLSDCVPSADIAPPVWPVIIDFGKARPIQCPKRYTLTEEEKKDYLKSYSHLAPELVSGLCPQAVSTDVYSLGHVVKKVAVISTSTKLKAVAEACKATPSKRPSIAFVRDSLFDL